MSAYDYTLNPYSGCGFGCTYCYAAFFTKDAQQQDNWGRWVTVKENAAALLGRMVAGSLNEKSIYLSSVTDPYQPVEKKLELTRQILCELAQYHRPRLVVQTRSPLVTRDIDVLQEFEQAQVNMTVTTDSEEVRRAFEPSCPANRVRLEAIQKVSEAGINSCITLTPLLPVSDPDEFIRQLLQTGVRKFVVQPFHPTRGKFVAGTRGVAKEVMRRYEWSEKSYHVVVRHLKEHLPDVITGKSGFIPPS